MLASDLHVHLYGCLTPEDIWELAKDSWRSRAMGLQRWADGMVAATGEMPNWQSFWNDESGISDLANFWLCQPNTSYLVGRFAAFEARFGLSITLFPIGFARDDLRVLQRVMARHRDEGRKYVEYRFVYPPRRSDLVNYSLKEHLDQLCRTMAEFESESAGAFEPRLAISCSREAALALTQYRSLKAWQKSAKPLFKRHLTGIDFSGYEEQHDLAELRDVCREVLRDNSRGGGLGQSNHQDALALLIHAGETMERNTIEVKMTDGKMKQQIGEFSSARLASLRRVQLAAEMGAHRIGHAVALSSMGLSGESEFLARDDAVAAVREAGCVIESCITSNLVVAGVPTLADHPLPEFLDLDLPVTLATDDPGIFATSAKQEYHLAARLIGDDKVKQLSSRARLYKSEILSGRES